MPIYKYLADQLEPFEETTFQSTGVREREDLQRLLRDQIDIVAPDTLVTWSSFLVPIS